MRRDCPDVTSALINVLISFYQLSVQMNRQLALRMFLLYDTGVGTQKSSARINDTVSS